LTEGVKATSDEEGMVLAPIFWGPLLRARAKAALPSMGSKLHHRN
jgi:hypothetical protein